MKSDDVTFWQLIKHILGFHTWSEWRYYEGAVYRNCEICSKEQEA